MRLRNGFRVFFFGPWQGRCLFLYRMRLECRQYGFLVYLRIYLPLPSSDHMALIQRVGGEQDMEKPSGLQQDIRPQEPTLKKNKEANRKSPKA